MFEIQRSTFELAVGMCCCLKICNSVVNMVVMELVLGRLYLPSVILLCPEYLPIVRFVVVHM